MGAACSTYGGGELYAEVWWKILRKKDHLENPGIDGRINKRIPFIFNDKSTGSCICLRLGLYMSYLQGCAFNTRL
jgi:hypothetical protein